MRWRYRHTVLALSLLAYFSIRFAQLVVSPVVPAIIDEFSVSRGTVGLALTGMWAAYALAQVPSGALGDRFGERAVVLAALALSGLGALAAAVAPSFAVFIGVALVLGAGAGLYYSAATALLSRLFDRLGRAIGFHRVGGQVSGLVAPVAAAAALPYGWRTALVLATAISVPALLVFAWRVRPAEPLDPDTPVREAVDLRRLSALLRRPPIAYAVVVATLGEFCLVATISFLPTFLVEHRGLGIAAAGLAFSAYFAVVGVSHPASGWLSDRLGRDAALGATLLAGAVGYAALAAGGPVAVAAPGVALVGFAMSWSSPLQSRVMDSLGPGEQGVGLGLVRLVYILVGSLGGVAVGAVADVAGWAPAFGLLAALLSVGVALVAANRALGIDI